MSEKNITPDLVKKIETALEERKPKSDRRKNTSSVPPTAERRAGKDRRND